MGWWEDPSIKDKVRLRAGRDGQRLSQDQEREVPSWGRVLDGDEVLPCIADETPVDAEGRVDRRPKLPAKVAENEFRKRAGLR